MRVGLLCLTLAATCSVLSAADKTLTDYRSIFEGENEKIEAAHEACLEQLLDRYGKQLDVARQKAKQDGDLVGVLALNKERERFAANRSMPFEPQPDSHGVVGSLRENCRGDIRLADIEKAKRTLDLCGKYVKRLTVVRQQLVKEDKLEEAVAFDAEIKRLNFIVAELQLKVREMTPQPEPESKPVTADAETTRVPVGLKELKLKTLRIELVPIGADVFTMGSDEGRGDERPPHEVTISRPYWIGKYELTQSQYRRVMDRDATTSSSWSHRDKPAPVSWDAAVEFCTKLTADETKRRSLPEGYVVRLPTEAEWEYAAKAGTEGRYFFGDTLGELGEYAWFDANSGREFHVVGEKKPNPWGLYDIYGNVSEWCVDFRASYPGEAQTDPIGVTPMGRPVRTYRGGGYEKAGEHCGSTIRHFSTASTRHNSLGMRVVVAPTIEIPR